MRAVVLAAGRGKRLGVATQKQPKPLLRLGGTSILDQNLALLATAGFSDVAINLHHLGSMIREHVGQGRYPGMKITFSEEDTLLGTAGGARKAAALLPPTWPLMVIYGDNLLRLDLGRMLEGHLARKADASIAVHWLADGRSSGLVAFAAEGRIESFVEKPQDPNPRPGWVNAGVYLLEKAAVETIPTDRPSDFGFDTFPELLRGGLRLYAHQLASGETVYGIDTPGRYCEAIRAVADQA